MWLIFDINGVIVKEPDSKAMKVFCSKNKKSFFFTILKYFLSLHSYQKGKVDDKTFWQNCLGNQGFEHIKKYYFQNNVFSKDFVEKIKKLKQQNFKIGILSNSNNLMTSIYKEKNIYDFADVVFLSDEISLMKPFPSVFRFVQKKLKVKPNDLLLIDDSLSNILIARFLGWNAYWFKDIKKWADFIKKMSK